jgi:uncharacterized protein (UPF0210 family)
MSPKLKSHDQIHKSNQYLADNHCTTNQLKIIEQNRVYNNKMNMNVFHKKLFGTIKRQNNINTVGISNKKVSNMATRDMMKTRFDDLSQDIQQKLIMDMVETVGRYFQ